MSKDQKLAEGLEEVVAGAETVVTEKAPKVKKEQTPEELAVIVAGVAQFKTVGVSENLAKVLELVPAWNATEEEKAAAKTAVIDAFGGSENLKNYIDTDFIAEVLGFQGIAKAIPVLNNIKSFYARREASAGTTSTKKVKLTQVSIGGVIYNVSVDYYEEIKALPAGERKALLLAHPSTATVNVAEEIF